MTQIKQLPDPFERVRQSTRRVVEAARLVRWDLARLRQVVASYNLAQIAQSYTFDSQYHFLGQGEALLDYVFSLDALNFGSGLSPQWKKLEEANLVQGSLYKTVADTLRRYSEGGQSLSPGWAARVGAAELAALFDIPADFELMTMFAHSLNELGGWIVAEYAGRYSRLVEESGTATTLVEKLVTNLSYFADQSLYDGQPVYFYKRAQILANDLYLAFQGQSYGAFPDIARLTMFADNLLPHYFRMVGVLHYVPELEAQIERAEPIVAGSPAEVELRAFAVQCVEQACRWLNETSPAQPVTPAQLDNYLWNFSQSKEIKARPRHRTVTYFY